MSNYRRAYIKGGCYFFTVVTHNRAPLFKQAPALTRLYDSFRYTSRKKPFHMDAYVILPDHLHCIWTLPEGDADFSSRWRLLKSYLSIGVRKQNPNWQEKVWQPRFWEHAISNENDYQRHLDYIHYNPVKHGYVGDPQEWRDSSFMGFVEKGFYGEAWGAEVPESIMKMKVE